MNSNGSDDVILLNMTSCKVVMNVVTFDPQSLVLRFKGHHSAVYCIVTVYLYRLRISDYCAIQSPVAPKNYCHM